MSTSPDVRRMVSEFLIAASICGSAYYFLADSAHAKLVKVRQEVAQVQAQEAARVGVGALTDAQVRELQRTTAQIAGEIRTKSAPAFDEATMFSRISQLAAAHSVRVEQLNPIASQNTPAPPALPAGVQPGTPAAQSLAPAAGGDAPPPPKDRRIGYSLAVSGSYPDLAAFIGGLCSDLGYTLIRSIQITQPDSQNAQLLRAAIETEHLGFDLSAVKVQALTSSTPNDSPGAPAATPSAAAATHE